MRIDPVTGATVEVVATRQHRPNLPTAGCPFCVGGLESPEAYAVRAFPNRWPSFDHCEVVLHGPEHGTTLAALGGDWPDAWLHLELVSPWRAAGVARFVAAGELGGGVLVNPVDPLDAAARLRAAG